MSNVQDGFDTITPDAEVQGVLSALSEALVKVIHGATEGTHPLAGQTVGGVRSALAGAYNVPNDAVAVIGENQVGDDYVLRPGESLEFVKLAGEKG